MKRKPFILLKRAVSLTDFIHTVEVTEKLLSLKRGEKGLSKEDFCTTS